MERIHGQRMADFLEMNPDLRRKPVQRGTFKRQKCRNRSSTRKPVRNLRPR